MPTPSTPQTATAPPATTPPGTPHAGDLRGCVAGADPGRRLDALLLNAPLRDYAQRPRVNDFTLPVLGMAYLATYAAERGFNVGVVDAEAHGMGVDGTIALVNDLAPRWVGLNLLAPTYQISARIAAGLDPAIKIMAGGHQAKAMPTEILTDPRMARCEALVLGEAETRVAELLADHRHRARLPGVMWLDPVLHRPVTGGHPGSAHYLAPDLNALPFVDRRFLAQDPHREAGRLEANMVGARGCPYDCSFCGAAVSANPDVSIRTRAPDNIIAEMHQLKDDGVTAFRFVDDLFLGARRVIATMMESFAAEKVGQWAVWDATGRINVLNRATDQTLDTLAANGLREVALGIESGSPRVLELIDKRITPEMTAAVVRRLTERGINVKGYVILGFPTETADEITITVGLIRHLWADTDRMAGQFRASAFEYRPYPGTPDWSRLLATGRYSPEQLTNYAAVDLTDSGVDEAMRERDEFNFSVNLPLAEAPIPFIRAQLVALAREQHARTPPPRTGAGMSGASGHRGLLVTLDGPGGVGKTTTAAHLSEHLRAHGYTVHATAAPSTDRLGRIARRHTDDYRAHSLACLVAADRYHQLDTEIRPHLHAGHIVVCDRYVPSSYVLQRIDGVPWSFIDALNSATERPDLAVILTAKPATIAERLRTRGAHHRFEIDPTSSHTETQLYHETLARLTARGHYPLLTVNTGDLTSAQVTAVIAGRIAELAGLPRRERDTA